jgi:hypothetical protein
MAIILAEDYGGMAAMLGFIWLILLTLSIAAIVSAWKIKWLTFLLAALPVLLGGFMVWAALGDALRGNQRLDESNLLFIIGPVPVIIGLFSMVVWFVRRFGGNLIRSTADTISGRTGK